MIKADEMKKKGAYNVREAIKNATGIDVSRNGTSMVGNNVSVRGMGTTETLILVDGRRIAGEDSASTMNAYELDRINVNQIDRVEILRGSGSAVWGSDATGGVINIITKKNKPQAAMRAPAPAAWNLPCTELCHRGHGEAEHELRFQPDQGPEGGQQRQHQHVRPPAEFLLQWELPVQ